MDNCNRNLDFTKILLNREINNDRDYPTQSYKKYFNCHFLPNTAKCIASFNEKPYCGIHSKNGNIFVSACQDAYIHLYDTSLGHFRENFNFCWSDMGWSILNLACNSDASLIVASSWSCFLNLYKMGENNFGSDLHSYNLEIRRMQMSRGFGIFSVVFSNDEFELLSGANDSNIYIYDLRTSKVSLKFPSHKNDVNAVEFSDDSSQIFFTAGDDGLCKAWDRRIVGEGKPKPVGVFVGHKDGIVFMNTKGDGHQLLTNSKDQTAKLWDMRCFSNFKNQTFSNQVWDYRSDRIPAKYYTDFSILDGDTSLVTYRGHRVSKTLIRAKFSPNHTTGQKFVYSGSSDGHSIIYDTLTGKHVTRLRGHKDCVRDISWHPYLNSIITSSFDCTLVEWTYSDQRNYLQDLKNNMDFSLDIFERPDRDYVEDEYLTSEEDY